MSEHEIVPYSGVKSRHGVELLTQDERSIAIVGIAGRYPQARDIDELWGVIKDGISAIVPIPTSRWDHRIYLEASGGAGKTRASHGGFLDDIEKFDSLLFKIAPRDAEMMDPQDRLFLEVAWAAFEDAGYPIERLTRMRKAGNHVGAFVGACFQQYQLLSEELQFKADNLVRSFGGIAGRVSHSFDLAGPSVSVDSACASSMMAIHSAVNALCRGDCEMAIAGGVNLTMHPLKLVGLSHLLSAQAESRPFSGGDGYISSEGVGALILKRISKAVEDKDHIHAVIRNVSVGHGGGANGYGVPNSEQLGRVINGALARSGVDSHSVGYVEVAANGTAQLDRAEYEALVNMFPASGGPRASLGSIKANIGHCEAVSTIAQLTKVVLQFRHKSLPPFINSSELDERVDFSRTSLRIQSREEIWSEREGVRTALVNSVGATGAYGCLVVQEGPVVPLSAQCRCGDHLIPLSAARWELLSQYAERLVNYLQKNPTTRICDIARTLQFGRNHLKLRAAASVAGLAELRDFLSDLVAVGPAIRREKVWIDGKATMGGAAPVGDDEIGRLARDWSSGSKVDWPHSCDDARHIPLPGYVFHKRHCWVSKPKPASPKRSQSEADIEPHSLVVVVGGGPAGIVAGKCLKDEGFEPLVLERSDRLGGVWAARDDYRTGSYRSTRTQNSKFTFYFSDFPPDEDAALFGGVRDVHDYLEKYVRHFKLRQNIRLNCQVLEVKACERGWLVTYFHPEKGVFQQRCRGVVCCSGQQWEPHIPEIRGRAEFDGLQITPTTYHSSEMFTNKRVLIVGAGVSGADLVSDAAEVAAECSWSVRGQGWWLPRMVGFVPNDCSVSFARRFANETMSRSEFLENLRRVLPDYIRKYQESGLMPKNARNNQININDRVVEYVAAGRIAVKGEVAALRKGGAEFIDGTTGEYDVIAFCTGYAQPQYHYLSPIRPSQFRDGVFYESDPSLCICSHPSGISAYGAALPYFELIGRWYAGALRGRYSVGAVNIGRSRQSYFDTWLESLKISARIGVLPDPRSNWTAYWEFVTSPPIPALFRLHGSFNWKDAGDHIRSVRRKFFTGWQDAAVSGIKRAVLAGLSEKDRNELLRSGQITRQEASEAAEFGGERLTPWLEPVHESPTDLFSEERSRVVS